MRVAGLGVAAIVILAAAPARAGEDVPALISLIQKQPAGMDRLTWKEQRRDATKKLGNSGDKRAVPVLIDLVENETFDIIGEIAIDGLGKLGDKSAIPVLEKVSQDQSRDVGQRDAAKKALAKLNAGGGDNGGGDNGGGDTGGGDTGGGDTGGGDTGGGDTHTGSGITTGGTIGGGGNDPVAVGPTWTDDTLAASERLTLVVGSASFGWDSVRRRGAFDLDAAGAYERSLDREKSGWKVGADAGLLFAFDNPDGAERNLLAMATVGGHGEFRGYAGPGVYGVGYAALTLGHTQIKIRRDSDNSGAVDDLDSSKFTQADVQIAIGGGWGRVLDIGTRARCARIAAVLERAHALGRPIDDSVARKLQGGWWALRGELGAHHRLTSTISILRDAGVLLGEPDAGLTYELLQVLQDPALDDRARGLEVDVAFGEGYLYRSVTSDPNAPGALTPPTGRLEEVLLRARFAQQLGDESDVNAGLLARKRLFAGDMVPAPWSVGIEGQLRKWVYGSHLDPKGALDLRAELGLSSDDRDDTNVGSRVGGEIGWTMILSRASSVRLSADLTLDSGEMFIGAKLEAAYGFLDSAFASSLK